MTSIGIISQDALAKLDNVQIHSLMAEHTVVRVFYHCGASEDARSTYAIAEARRRTLIAAG